MQDNFGHDDRRKLERDLEQRLSAANSQRSLSASSADPDMLRQLVQDSLHLTDETAQLSGSEIRSLKTSSKKGSGLGVAVARLFGGFLSGINSALSGICAPPAAKRDLCQTGHVLPPKGSTWQGAYPKCVRCGHEISSLDDLRAPRPKKS